MRILIAEDSIVQHDILKHALEECGYEVVSAHDGNQAWDILTGENAPQLVLLDWVMPGMEGAQVCQKVRERGNEPYTYIIMLTARDEKEDTVAGLDAGADDYLTKPFDADELRARLRAGERILELQEQLISAREDLRRQATHDSLTGLLNRRAIEDALGREVTRGGRHEVSVGVVMSDIDHFKHINDTYGHQTGDAVLREVALRMVATVRPYDAVGRYGGEEFLMVLPACDAPRAGVAAERIRDAVANKPTHGEGVTIPITISLGVATTAEIPTSNIDALIHAADTALYRAKQGGRNRVEIALPTQAAPASLRSLLLTACKDECQ